MKHLFFSILLAFLLGPYSPGHASAIAPGQPGAGSTVQVAGEHVPATGKREMFQSGTTKIMAVLETRIADPEVLAKSRDKLLTLDHEEIGLMSSLCDLISHGQQTAQAEIAFSLVTALIVLS